MQCDYCGQEILGHGIHVEIRDEDMGPETDLMPGELYFCNPDCHSAYLEEAGIPLDSQMSEDEGDEEESLFSDRIRYTM